MPLCPFSAVSQKGTQITEAVQALYPSLSATKLFRVPPEFYAGLTPLDLPPSLFPGFAPYLGSEFWVAVVPDKQ